jgi:hypothetical protein
MCGGGDLLDPVRRDGNNLMDSGRALWVIADSTLKALLGVHRLEALIVSTYLAPSPSVPTCPGALARVNRTPGASGAAHRGSAAAPGGRGGVRGHVALVMRNSSVTRLLPRL